LITAYSLTQSNNKRKPLLPERIVLIFEAAGLIAFISKHIIKIVRIVLQQDTSYLRKAHVTRDSSGPATMAISVGLQQ